jgi:hypothetical protein
MLVFKQLFMFFKACSSIEHQNLKLRVRKRANLLLGPLLKLLTMRKTVDWLQMGMTLKSIGNCHMD